MHCNSTITISSSILMLKESVERAEGRGDRIKRLSSHKCKFDVLLAYDWIYSLNSTQRIYMTTWHVMKMLYLLLGLILLCIRYDVQRLYGFPFHLLINIQSNRMISIFRTSFACPAVNMTEWVSIESIKCICQEQHFSRYRCTIKDTEMIKEVDWTKERKKNTEYKSRTKTLSQLMCLFNMNIMDIKHDAPCWVVHSEWWSFCNRFTIYSFLFRFFFSLCHHLLYLFCSNKRIFPPYTNWMKADFLLIDFAVTFELGNHILTWLLYNSFNSQSSHKHQFHS